jgi:hypothetical protein
MSRFRRFKGFKGFKGFAIGLAMFSSLASAQRPDPPPATSGAHFEVVSIRRNVSGGTDDRMNVAPRPIED